MSEVRTCEGCGMTAYASTGRVQRHTIESDDGLTVIEAVLCAECYDAVQSDVNSHEPGFDPMVRY